METMQRVDAPPEVIWSAKNDQCLSDEDKQELYFDFCMNDLEEFFVADFEDDELMKYENSQKSINYGKIKR